MTGYILVVGLLQAALTWGFNLETSNPSVFLQSRESYFGYQVCHFGAEHSNSVLVTSPLHGNGTGAIYKCPYKGQCELLPMEVTPGISLGLSLACTADRAMVCGPRLTQQCQRLDYLNGLCVELAPSFTEKQRFKPAFQECHNTSLDAVVLFDSSQSISSADFDTMIKFIKEIIRMFSEPWTQVAVAQYATTYHAVFEFENFAVTSDPISLMKVSHMKGHTHTAGAIRFVLDTMFKAEKGMQKDSKKLLVVITDGESNDKDVTLDEVLPQIENMNVTTYAIGVGDKYSYDELLKIALNNKKNVLRTDSFDKLATIEKELRSQIFAIEGMGAASNYSSFHTEVSQGGFSIALSKGTEESAFGAVGAYEWSGGLARYGLGGSTTFINASAEETDLRDSYLGYAVATLRVNQTTVYFASAPRYQHTGVVLGFQQSGDDTWTVTQRIYGTQFGSYFGSALCALTGESNGRQSLLAIGAPLYQAKSTGGEVRICTMHNGAPNCSQYLRGVPGERNGQFGASLSSCPDLNGDGAPELAVGAPYENSGSGGLYIFLSHSNGIRSEYSQRLRGSKLDGKLQYFGLSVHSGGDLSADGLTDLVVGGRGAAVIIRSHPVMCLRVSVTLDPPIISQDSFHCSAPLGLNRPVSTVNVCVTLDEVLKGNIQTPFQAAVSLSLELDQIPHSPPRLLFSKPSSSHWNMTLKGQSDKFCQTLTLTLPDCIEDYRDVNLTGELLVKTEEIPGSNGLRPIPSPDCPLSFLNKVPLEKVCGEDHVCVSDLEVSIKFNRPVVVNSTSFPVDVSVKVVNNGEDASGTQLKLHFPSSLSYSHARRTVGVGAVACASNSSEAGSFVFCDLGSTLIRQKAETSVQISFLLYDRSSLTDTLSVNVSVTSTNEKEQTLQDNVA
ncbi:integrin alpha-M-like [Engraulis encrasicolus]|uniref:integrin alpha-M-like n=1 Tax=Engraulis encrasicolus TaxID=184585 RepID=UPI002FD252EC